MTTTIITQDYLDMFRSHLRTDEKSWHTIRKYVRDAWAFWSFADVRPLTKDLTVDYKQFLIESGKYTDGSINSMLASLRGFFKYLGREDCCVTSIRTQETPYCPENRWLAMEDYQKLLDATKRGSRLEMILKVLGGTGIRISELKYFTVEALRKKRRHATIRVSCKKKSREILIPDDLREELFKYMKEHEITEGVIFRTRGGKPVDRSNLWKQMKRLCKKAGVDEEKVYPHNLRKLFARTFYEVSHDLAQLACLLGHSSVNTTMIYVKRTESEVRTKVERMMRRVQCGSLAYERQDMQGQNSKGWEAKDMESGSLETGKPMSGNRKNWNIENEKAKSGNTKNENIRIKKSPHYLYNVVKHVCT